MSKYREEYSRVKSQYRKAVIQMREAVLYKNNFAKIEKWDEDRDKYKWLKTDSEKYFTEIYLRLKHLRSRIADLEQKLITEGNNNG